MISETINKIEQVLIKSENHSIFDKYGVDLGISSGRLGFSLFYYYHYLFTGDERNLNILMDNLNKCVQGINKNYKGSFLALDMIQITQFFYFLKEEGIIEDDLNEFCDGYDKWIESYLEINIKKGNFALYDGILRTGEYFLTRFEDVKTENQIEKILYALEDITVRPENTKGLYFNYAFRHNRLELGKAHGQAGIIYFLLRLYNKGLFKNRCLKLLDSSINYLLSQKKKKGNTLYPFDIKDSKVIKFGNINYGDIGIGYTLYYAGKILNNEKLSNEGIEIILNFAKRRDDKGRYVLDASLLYGTTGIYSFLKLFESSFSHDILKKASDYWFNRTMDFGRQNTKWAGYNTFFNGERDHLQLSFDQGIIGIGICLMCSEMQLKPKYLRFMNYNLL